MELKKTSENNNRNFDADGNVSYSSESANYEIKDSEGNLVGNASVNLNNDYGNISINLNGFETLAEGEEKLKGLLGIE